MPSHHTCIAHTHTFETNWFDLSFHFKRCKRKINESNPYRMHCFSLASALYLGFGIVCVRDDGEVQWFCLCVGVVAVVVIIRQKQVQCHFQSYALSFIITITEIDVFVGSCDLSGCLFVKCWHIVSAIPNISATEQCDMIEVCVYVYRNN